jgi:hypothetical protein
MGKGLVGVSGKRALVWLAVGTFAASTFAVVPAAASSGSSPSNTREISASGVTSIRRTTSGTDSLQFPEIANGRPDSGSTVITKNPTVDRSQTGAKSGSGDASAETGRQDSGLQQVVSFDGLNHRKQRLANNGNQFSVEPPDQGLCVGNGFVMETVNDVLNVYSTSGTSLLGVTDLNTFYGYAPAIIRPAGQPRGPFVTDPSCYFDVATQRWFHVALTLEVKASAPHAGAFLGPNHLDIAVSKTSSPLGAWTIYRTPVQDDGSEGTPNHHCTLNGPGTGFGPCIGDYPHIGADANGFYITTNEYSFFGPEFKAAQVYAYSKHALAASHATISVSQIDTTDAVDGDQAGFTVWPAVAPNGHFATESGGTEYFLSSNAADEVNAKLSGTSKDLIVWALTNTASLDSASPHPSLANTVVQVARYTAPPLSNQKAGNTPLRDCINDTTMATRFGPGCWQLFFNAEPAHNEVESKLDSNDTRMQQVMYAGGRLVGALDTALRVNGKAQAGIEWFSVTPTVTRDGLEAELSGNGYFGAPDTNLTYPAIGVNEHGDGVMAFTLLGTNDFPSAAYAPFNANSGPGQIQIAAAGVGPDDGFTSYVAFVGAPPRTRWGDYGAAAVDGSNVWIASEYIGQSCTFAQYTTFPFGSCGATRTSLGNWDTRITEVAIGD